MLCVDICRWHLSLDQPGGLTASQEKHKNARLSNSWAGNVGFSMWAASYLFFFESASSCIFYFYYIEQEITGLLHSNGCSVIASSFSCTEMPEFVLCMLISHHHSEFHLVISYFYLHFSDCRNKQCINTMFQEQLPSVLLEAPFEDIQL